MGNIKQVKWLARMCVFALLLVPAQSPADSSSMAGMGDELSLFQEIPSVFSASKYEQKVTEAPSSVTIITADEISKAGYKTLAEVLASVRSFYVYTDHNYDYVGVRGFGLPGDYNTRLLLMIDGHRVNDEIFSSAMIGRDFYIDVDLIERIEISRGPSSSLYGSSAFFGVIDVITKSGRDYKGFEGSVSAGDDDLIGGRLSYGQKFDNDLELLVSGSYTEGDGDDWYFKEFDDPYYNNGHADGIDERRDYSFFLKAEQSDFTLTAAYNKMKDGYPTAPWETEFNNDDSDTTDEYFYADLEYNHFSGSNLEISARLYYDYSNSEGIYPYDWADYDADEDADPYILNGEEYFEGQTWGVNFQVAKSFGSKHRVIVGADYRDGFKQDQDYYNYRNKTLDPEFDYIDYQVLNSKEDSDTLGLFIQEEMRINEELILNLGLRYDHYSTSGNTTNPRAALIYAPRQSTALKFLYGSAFRAPNAYELYYTDGGESQLANPDLDSERISTYEFVWEEQVTNNFKTVVNSFYYEVKDLISQKTVYEDGWPLLIFVNADKIDGYGFELELEGTLLEKVATRFSYSYQKTEDSETDDELSNAPKHLGKLNITVPVWQDIVFLNLEELYTSSSLTVEHDRRIGDSWVTNLNLYADNPIDGLTLSFSVNNLFDEYYETSGFGEHEQTGLEQPGRHAVLKATYSF